MARRLAYLPLALAPLLAALRTADALETGKYLLDPGGKVQAVRALDVDADGHPDLIALVEAPRRRNQFLLVLRTPATPARRRYIPPDHVTRIPCDGDLAAAGAVAAGRFGPAGEARLRFMTAKGIVELRPDGTRVEPASRLARPTLFARSPGRSLVFWDGVADLDGDGIDEMWCPLARGDGPLMVFAGRPAADRVLALSAANRGSSDELGLLGRSAKVPNLFPADLDGDGRHELLALDGTALVAWSLGDLAGSAQRPLEPGFRLALPFLEPDPDADPEDQRVPRIQVEDVDRDGKADLLVTLITGKRSRVESLRTIFFHYPGPFRDPATGALVSPRARIDTLSVVLHPTFVDMDGDGDLEYVGDSIRGSRADLVARVLGKAPTITYVAFRFEERTGTFEGAPYFTAHRTYPSAEALSNRFGRNAWLGGDFDGDGHADMLDLGDLGGVAVLRGHRGAGRRGRDPLTFELELVPRVPVKEGLAADALVTDLNGDGRDDAVLWSDKSMFFIVSKGAR
jgi:hypothetical protein